MSLPPADVPTPPDSPLGLTERILRALLSVMDDLSVERNETKLLRTTLEHVVADLGFTGGVTLLGDTHLVPSAEIGLGVTDIPDAQAVGKAALAEGKPTVRVVEDGWMAAAPLITRTQKLGALVLYDHTGSPPPDPALLLALGRQIGNGLENVRLFAQLRTATDRLRVLNRLTATLSAALDMKAVLPEFAAALHTVQEFDQLACGFVNDSGDYIEVSAFPEDTAWGFGSVLPVVGSGPGAVILNNEAVLQLDLLHHHRFIEDMKLLDEGIRSYLLLPLFARGRPVGVLALGSKRVNAFDESSVEKLQPLADSVAVALENIRLFQKTREMSITDEVTPLFNFRFFHQILDRELKLVDRYESILSVIFLDLDRFKPINDTYGHLRGSRVLREVGFLLRAAVRETDYPARYGGDEFVVILPQTDRLQAEKLVEKLRRLIEGHTFLQEEGINARIGVSLGVASYPGEATTKEALIRLADERMYADKQDRTRA